MVRVPRRVFQRLLPERPTPERCVEACSLQRTRFERVAERKLRRRQLTEDGNVEISGRDLRKVPGPVVRAIDIRRLSTTLLGHSAFTFGMALPAPKPPSAVLDPNGGLMEP